MDSNGVEFAASTGCGWFCLLVSSGHQHHVHRQVQIPEKFRSSLAPGWRDSPGDDEGDVGKSRRRPSSLLLTGRVDLSWGSGDITITQCRQLHLLERSTGRTIWHNCLSCASVAKIPDEGLLQIILHKVGSTLVHCKLLE